MADWDSVDCKKRFLDTIGVEDANELDADADIYPLLADGQEEALRELCARYPDAFYTGITTLVTADSKIFTWPVVNGQAVMPMGWVQVAPRKSAFIGEFFTGWVAGVEFLDRGANGIEIPGDRTYSGTLYSRYVPRPARITAGVGPSLLPLEIGVDLLVNRAAAKWARQGNQAPAVARIMDEEWGMPKTRTPGIFATAMLTYKRRFRGGGGMIDPAQWYLQTPDLGGVSR